MKKRFSILGIILTTLCALSISSCDERTTNGMDPIVDILADPTKEESIVPPTEPVMPTTDSQVKPVIPPTSGQTVVFVNSPQISSPAVGQQLNINVDITGATNIFGYEMTIVFDPSALRYVEAVHAGYLPTGSYDVSPKTSASKVYLASASGTPAAANNGTLVTVTFEVVASKASTIQLMDVRLSNNSADRIVFTTVDGEISAL